MIEPCQQQQGWSVAAWRAANKIKLPVYRGVFLTNQHVFKHVVRFVLFRLLTQHFSLRASAIQINSPICCPTTTNQQL
jgi:hypothetical protein